MVLQASKSRVLKVAVMLHNEPQPQPHIASLEIEGTAYGADVEPEISLF